MNKTKVVVTGASGFVGKHLIRYLELSDEHLVIPVSRANEERPISQTGHIVLNDLFELANIDIEGAEVLVHLASYAHKPISSEFEFKTILEQELLEASHLLKLAVEVGLKRFVFLSTANVYGDNSSSVLSEQSLVCPNSYLAKLKFHIEELICEFCANQSLEFVILRSPLVYANDAPANFRFLINLVNKMPILPFGMVDNRRSYIGVSNLITYLILFLTEEKSNGQVFNVADDNEMSTTELIYGIAKVVNSNLINIKVPKILLKLVFVIAGKKELADKLLDDFVLDTEKLSVLVTEGKLLSIEQELNKKVETV